MNEVSGVREQLSYAWNDWVITDAEAGEAADIIMRAPDPADLLKQLKPQELERLADNLPSHKRQDLSNHLAGKLDGKSLAQLAVRFGRADVTAAVNTHASAQTKADYLAALPPAAQGPVPSPSPGVQPSAPPPTAPNHRGLTSGEIALAKKVFGDSIDYSKVRIHDSKYFPLQSDDIAMTPDGDIYWPQDAGDMSVHNPDLFIHEMTHVYQHQHGVNVLARGAVLQGAYYGSFKQYNPYEVHYQPGKAFGCYNIEQQGDLAVDVAHGRVPNIIPQDPHAPLNCAPSPGTSGPLLIPAPDAGSKPGGVLTPAPSPGHAPTPP